MPLGIIKLFCPHADSAISSSESFHPLFHSDIDLSTIYLLIEKIIQLRILASKLVFMLALSPPFEDGLEQRVLCLRTMLEN